jgi:hypothetical protein
VSAEERLRDLLRAMHLMGAVGEGSAVDLESVARLLPDAALHEVHGLVELGERLGYLSRSGDRLYLTLRGEISAISISS